jgi:hypothetical protein
MIALARLDLPDCVAPAFSQCGTVRKSITQSPESGRTAFIVFAPAVLDQADRRIDVIIPGHEGHDIINIVGLYPIHETERQYIHQHGLQPFWNSAGIRTTSHAPAV